MSGGIIKTVLTLQSHKVFTESFNVAMNRSELSFGLARLSAGLTLLVLAPLWFGLVHGLAPLSVGLPHHISSLFSKSFT